MALLTTLGWILVDLWVFWGLYLVVMGLYRAQLAGQLSPLSKILGAPYVALGWLMDVAVNATLASLLFMELPAELLVTSRLKRHLKTSGGWRGRLATWLCSSLLDPFDPTGKHCQ